MISVAEAVTNNNNNSVGTGPVNFEAASGNTQRFKKLTEEDLKAIEINQYSDATKRNTKWGIGVFNGNFFNVFKIFFCAYFQTCIGLYNMV